MKQLVVFFCLAYGLSWIIWLPLYGPKLGIHGLPVLPYHHGLGGFGPMLAAFATTWLFSRKAGVRRLLQQCLQLKPWAYLLVALLSPFVLVTLALLLNYWMAGTPIEWHKLGRTTEFPEFGFMGFLLYNLLCFGFGEETGWRGFALPRLQARTTALTATLLLTALWALWHWPLFLYRPRYVGMDALGIAGFVLSMFTGAVLFTWLYNSTRGSIFICALFHATVDVAFTNDGADAAVMNYTGFLITLWGIATILAFRPKNLATTQRTIIDS
jgi:membrane protease YdiL (CAAX protease family)